jgi:tetratricopeptide (TPR) repeat protein
MVTRKLRLFSLLVASVLLGACGQKLDLEVKARMDGTPAAQAKVTVDGEALGQTDAQGVFAQQLKKKAGAEVEVSVIKEQQGYRIEPWKSTFLVKLPKDGQTDVYRLEADLKATRYVSLRVADKDGPVADAKVVVGGTQAGTTDAKGELLYVYKDQPQRAAEVRVSKNGYSAYKQTRSLVPGEVIDVALQRQSVVAVRALTDEYGRIGGVAGVSVSVNGKPAGKTDAQGEYRYIYNGEPGKLATIVLAAPGYVPAEFKTSVKLEGEIPLQRYFYPTSPKPIRLGVYRVIGNTPGADLKDLAAQTEQTLTSQLFKFPGFREVPSAQLQAEVKKNKLNVDRIAAKGWQETPLRASVDMMVFGSIAKDDDGYLIEAKVHTAGGKIVVSELARARSEGRIPGAVRDIVNNIIERFPFEGTVIGVEGERYRLNVGKNWRIARGTEFTLSAPSVGEGGKIAGYRETGRLEVKRGDDQSSLAEVAALKPGEKIRIGDRAVRRIAREGEEDGQRTYVLLTAKGGVGNNVIPLTGANVYLDGNWAGSTGANGQAEIPLRLNRNYTLVLYRHGYQQVSEKIKIAKSGESREFALAANNALFKVDSQPAPASVSIDDEQVGKTPIADGRQVTLGFHNVRLSYSEDYRDFFEVMEFSKKEEDRTGDRRIILYKDLLKVGDRLHQKGDVDGAIAAYAGTERGHPDYAEAHRRLGRIYLDDKDDYDRAIAEFEAVLSMPENQQLIYKQFAVTFTNLGHAYYEKGDHAVSNDRNAASEYFAKAVKALQTARQNTRFFPNAEYDEAVHDTYYYTALSYHKLYLITKQPNVQNSASLAWREYFDFFPKKLEGNPEFEEAREAARRYRDQVGEL